jgi:hypothetical protein
MERRREFFFGLLTVGITIGSLLLAAEVTLRFLPVASGMRTLPVTPEKSVFHFTPNRDFLYSRDWDMVLSNRGRVNNAGFVNDQDYQTEDNLPLIAVIGDSMIEAPMVPFWEALSGRLAAALSGKARVYSFAASGAPLSQYLIWARHAVREYGARALIINVVGNDYDESHARYKRSVGFWCYVPDGSGQLHLRLLEYHPGRLRDLVLASALARYVVFNLQFGARWLELKDLLLHSPGSSSPRYAGNTEVDASTDRIRDSLAVLDAFFRDLPQYTGLPPSRISIVVDGLRYPEAARAAAGTYFELVRKEFLSRAASLGYDTIDLDVYFFEHFRRSGERFEFARDGHWNSIGHQVASEAVIRSNLVKRFISHD